MVELERHRCWPTPSGWASMRILHDCERGPRTEAERLARAEQRQRELRAQMHADTVSDRVGYGRGGVMALATAVMAFAGPFMGPSRRRGST